MLTEREFVIKQIEGLKIWKEENKQYIINHLYLQKIKDYLLKEYGGRITSDPLVRNEYCSDHGDIEEYNSRCYVHVHFDQKTFRNKDCVSFHIEYSYTIYKKDNKLWEDFSAYRESDKVYIQGASDGDYPKEYRYEFNRAWQEGGIQRIYIEPKK